jgi:hypothetical protein
VLLAQKRIGKRQNRWSSGANAHGEGCSFCCVLEQAVRNIFSHNARWWVVWKPRKPSRKGWCQCARTQTSWQKWSRSKSLSLWRWKHFTAMLASRDVTCKINRPGVALDDDWVNIEFFEVHKILAEWLENLLDGIGRRRVIHRQGSLRIKCRTLMKMRVYLQTKWTMEITFLSSSSV